MPINKPKRCGRVPAGFRPMPRACIDSLPRYCMPRCPILHPHLPYRPCVLHNGCTSSHSDCEEYCTVENCSNAPMCIRTQPQFCPYGVSRPEQRQQYGRMRIQGRVPYFDYFENISSREAAPSFVQPQGTSSPLVSRDPGLEETIEDERFNTPRYPPVNFNPSSVQSVPFDLQRAPQSPVRNVLPQFTNVSYGPQNADPLLLQEDSHITHSDQRTNSISLTSTTHSTANERGTDTEQNPLYFDQQRRERNSMHVDNSKVGPNLFLKPANSGSRKFCNNQSCRYSTPKDEEADETPYSNHNGAVQDLQSTTFNSGEVVDAHDHILAGPSQIFSRSGAEENPIANQQYLHSTAHESLMNIPKCSCRYPPAFKHFSCTGNISGSCDCDNRPMQD